MISQGSQEEEAYASMIHGGPHLHPPNKPKVLSIGGAGFSWASGYAATHPNASVLTMDLQCFIRQVPEVGNHQVHEVRDLNNLELDTLPAWDFDFVRVDKLSGRINWEDFLVRVYELLKPGAYLVLCDSSKKFWEMGGSSYWTIASSWFDHFGADLGVNYNMLASSEIEPTLTKA